MVAMSTIGILMREEIRYKAICDELRTVYNQGELCDWMEVLTEYTTRSISCHSTVLGSIAYTLVLDKVAKPRIRRVA